MPELTKQDFIDGKTFFSKGARGVAYQFCTEHGSAFLKINGEYHCIVGAIKDDYFEIFTALFPTQTKPYNEFETR